jgi:hypothetical protein
VGGTCAPRCLLSTDVLLHAAYAVPRLRLFPIVLQLIPPPASGPTL